MGDVWAQKGEGLRCFVGRSEQNVFVKFGSESDSGRCSEASTTQYHISHIRVYTYITAPSLSLYISFSILKNKP